MRPWGGYTHQLPRIPPSIHPEDARLADPRSFNHRGEKYIKCDNPSCSRWDTQGIFRQKPPESKLRKQHYLNGWWHATWHCLECVRVELCLDTVAEVKVKLGWKDRADKRKFYKEIYQSKW